MVFTALHEKKDIEAAYDQLMKTLKRGTNSVETGIGWPGGHKVGDVFLNPRLGVWTHSYPDNRNGRYVIFVGSTKPVTGKQVPIDFEVNPPFQGRNLRCAGAFVMDSNGEIYLTHSGKIAGGHKGVGKNAFLDRYGRDKLDEVVWPGDKPSQAVILGPIDSPKLLRFITGFSAAVRRFKDEVKSGKTRSNAGVHKTPADYSAEFWGTKRYTTKQTVEAKCDHGIVVEELRTHLEDIGKRVGNDENRDLFVQSRNGRIVQVFEIKTKCTLPDLTKAVGQVYVYSALDKPTPTRTVVFPKGLDLGYKRKLKILKIALLEYEWDGETPRFKNLETVLV